nr:unnamed protein product [Callosobruchus analis]
MVFLVCACRRNYATRY